MEDGQNGLIGVLVLLHVDKAPEKDDVLAQVQLQVMVGRNALAVIENEKLVDHGHVRKFVGFLLGLPGLNLKVNY